MRISLTDNDIGQSDAGAFLREDVAALLPIAGKTIIELCGENENPPIFLYNIETLDDMIGKSSIMNIPNTDDPDKVRIATNNVMDFVGTDNLQIKIESRFNKGRDGYFLRYMPQKVLPFNLSDLGHNSEEEDVFDFIVFMFPCFLRAAMRQGVYREYQNSSHNNANLKGTTDIVQHIIRNAPFVGNMAYSTREYSHDNNMTELIQHIIEFMKTKRYGQSVLNIDRKAIENVRVTIEHTPLYNKNERGYIVNENLRVRAHPYFAEYRPLQMLCLRIPRMGEVKYGENNDDICGILFDGIQPWEEYANTTLRDHDLKHPENKLRKGGICLFDNHSDTCYPDFYKDDVILDARCKLLDSYDRVLKVDDGDIHQVIVYMTTLKIDQDGFVAPLN